MRADLTVRAGTFTVAAALAAEPGEVVALVGPNGAGKTTLLRALGGLTPAEGRLELAGRDVLALPPEQRGIGWVPQAGLLFPHLTALDNAAYGLRSRGMRKEPARSAARSLLDRLGVGEHAGRRPAQLSGGQAQRVALARALAGRPQLVLLDEPLAALDAGIRDDVRRMLRATLAGGPAVSIVVTHDPVDAVVLADRIVVLEGGAVVQDAPATQVAAAPRSEWVARLLGTNAWRGTTTAQGLRTQASEVVAADPLTPGLPALALIDPTAVSLYRAAPVGSPRNVLAGTVGETSALGGRVRVQVTSSPPITAEITPAAAAELHLAEGGTVWASWKATSVRLVPV
jgi:molybdate transport system permease protein